MADITRRVQSRASALFECGEVVAAAVLVEPRHTYGIGSVAVAVLPRTRTLELSRKAAESGRLEGGTAATFPSGPCVMAITDRRVAVIPSNGLRFTEIRVSYALGDIRLTESRSAGLGRRLHFSFADTTGVVVDAQRGQPFEALATLLGGR